MIYLMNNNIKDNSYDKSNNDTYVTKYGNSMAYDVEMHMFQSDDGSTFSGKVRGIFSVETAIAAKNNVLHFENAKSLSGNSNTDFNLQLIKHKDKESLVPLSLMKRYERPLYDITYTQKNPIFFDLNSEKFVCLMDSRVLRDMENNPEFKTNIFNIPDVSIVSSKNNEQILLSYDSLSGLYEDKTGIYEEIKKYYLKEMLNIFPGEDVIVVNYSLEENKKSHFSPNGGYSPIIQSQQIASHIFSSANIQFEFLKARKVAPNHYYLYENEDLNVNSLFYLDKDKKRKEINEQNSEGIPSIILGNNNSVTVVQYSKSDWQVLSLLKTKIDHIFTDLDSLLLKQKTNDGLDKPLTQIKHEDYLAICNTNNEKNNENHKRLMKP